MKRNLCLFSLGLLLAASVWSEAPPRLVNPQSVMKVWEQAIRTRNLDAFADCYWENAAQLRLMPDGHLDQREGIRAILEFQSRLFEEAGRDIGRFRLPAPIIHPESFTGLPIYVYDNPDLGATEIFWYGERAGVVRIERHFLILRYFEEIEVGEMQAWADKNRDGILHPAEQEVLFEAFRQITHEPHRVSNPLDEFCDWNGNRRIDEEEVVLARGVLIRDSLRRGYVHFPRFAREYLDQNRSGSIDLGEADAAFELAFGPRRGGQPIMSPLDEKIDFNQDGEVNEFERDIFSTIVIRFAATIPAWPVFEKLAEGRADWVISWADANEDGEIGEEELWDVGRLMRSAVAETEIISTPIGLLYDENFDLRLSAEERTIASEELLADILPEVTRLDALSYQRRLTISQLDVNENGWLDSEEIDDFGDIALHPEWLVNDAPGSDLERRIDRQPRDGTIDEWEVFSFTDGVFATIAEIWLAQSGEEGRTAVGYADYELQVVGDTDVPSAVREPVGDGAKETLAEAAKTGEPAREAGPADAAAGGAAVTGSLAADVTLYPVFPVLFKYHDTAPVGKVVLRNDMSVAATNVQVTLEIPRYIDTPRISATIESLAAGEEKSVDLLALFNEDVLTLTEGTRSAAQVIIDYKASAVNKKLAVTETLTFYDRNAIQWDDDKKVACFVTAKDPQIRLLATNMTALIRRSRNESVSENLQNAMAFYAALVQHNLGYNVDPTSSYKVLSKDSLQVDYVQFPRQTLMFKGGDCDDLSVCFASLLEAIGIPSAFITIPGHIYVALGLEMDASTAKGWFSDPDDLIFAQDGTVWVPVETTKLNDNNPDFLDAWEEGAKEWREHDGRGQAKLIPTRSAWETYEPVAASFMTETVALPDTEKVLEAFQRDLSRFIGLEIADQELTMKAKLSRDPDNPRYLNLLGTLYARYGLSDKAREQFNAAVVSKEYFAALMNLGHLEFLDENYEEAADYYERALKAYPDNANAILALARTDHELENYGNVKRYYAQLQDLDPELAEEYGYLDLRASESVRAEEATRLRRFVIWEIEEEE